MARTSDPGQDAHHWHEAGLFSLPEIHILRFFQKWRRVPSAYEETSQQARKRNATTRLCGNRDASHSMGDEAQKWEAHAHAGAAIGRRHLSRSSAVIFERNQWKRVFEVKTPFTLFY
jgi:hypothetical protein